ncbi:MAG: UvrD-helicase domain-containing protein [Oscillospiraceae bacterium]|nr:UvrD-helicase domain-containing protein [Oscillospiraceae bacterium]
MSAHFTDEQEYAIKADGSFIIVSAAAGSGKTTVLIEKLIRILSDPDNAVRADRLIVVTFTNDAAGQIVRKLNKAIGKAISECGSDPYGVRKKAWLIRQQSYLGAAKISTISSFCFNLIRSHADRLGITSDFRIIDDQEEKLLLIRALEETADAWFDDPEKSDRMSEIYSYFDYYTNNSDDKSDKYRELIPFRSFLLSIPFSKERYVEPFLEEYKKGYSDSFDPFDTYYGSIYAKNYFSVLNDPSLLESVKLIYSHWSVILHDDSFPSKLAVTAKKHFTNSADTLIRLYSGLCSGSMPDFSDDTAGLSSEDWNRAAECMNISGDLFRTDLKTKGNSVKAVCKAAGIDQSTAAEITAAFDKIGAVMSKAKDIYPCTAEELKTDYVKHYEKLSLLIEFIDDINDRFDKLKAEKNGLSFSDGELLALRLLGRLEGDRIVKTDIAEELSKEFQLILIDEFQDSNDMQDMIFRLLSPCGTSKTEGKNMFVVGDIKQSIYNFRLANPKLFYGYLKSSVPYPENLDSDEPRNILLNKNFRSSKSVIDFVNLVFGRLMTEQLGGIDYDDTQKLIYSGNVWEEQNPSAADIIGDADTELLLVDTRNTPFSYAPADESKQETGSADGTPEEDGDDIADARLEAQAVALKIHMLLKEHPKLSCRDICILCPTNGDAPIFAEALMKLGIRASLDNRSEYIASREISVMLNMLKILDNPHNNTAMAGVLMSPMFMFSADDAAALNVLRGKRSYYYAVRSSAEDMSFITDNEDAQFADAEHIFNICRSFIGIYDHLKECAAVMSLEDIIRKIYSETGIIEMMSLYPNGETRRANLNLLPRYAAAYEKNVACGTGGIYGFIRYVDAVAPNRNIDFSSGSSSSESDNAVSIKTIHKSKGLEYPVVFLCRTGKTPRSNPKKLYYSMKNGVAFYETDPKSRTGYVSLPAMMIGEEEAHELVSERMRLMYVAMTRAKCKLFISGTLMMTKKDSASVYRENAVPANGIYKDIECDITECSPDEGIKGILDKLPSDVFSKDGINSAALLKAGEKMLTWILAALAADGTVPYTRVFGNAPAEPVNVRIKALRTDRRLMRSLSADNNQDDRESFISCTPDPEFLRQLEELRRYDVSPEFASDREKENIPAKLTVTEITHKASEEDVERIYSSFLPKSDRFAVGEKPGGKLSASEKGTAVHSFMQYADLKALCDSLGTEDDPVGSMAQQLYFDGLLGQEAADHITDTPKVKQRIINFFSSPLWTDCISKAKDEDILTEQPFLAKISDIFDINGTEPLDLRLKTYYNDNYSDTFVQGIADLIIKTDDGFILVDYKTNEGRAPSELKKMYEVQMLLYTRAFEKIFGLAQGSGKAYIYSFGIDSDCTIKIK